VAVDKVELDPQMTHVAQILQISVHLSTSADRIPTALTPTAPDRPVIETQRMATEGGPTHSDSQEVVMTRLSSRSRGALLTVVALAAAAGVAFAGPPLLCHPFDIGTARSLPWDGSNGWPGRAAAGNMPTLVADTEALLTPSTPVIVRMETLRRAALYASRDESVATTLLERLQARAREAGSSGKPDPLAAFDAGYLIETYRQIGQMHGNREQWKTSAVAALVARLDGYAMVQTSLAARPDDPAIEFAAALIAGSGNSANERAAYARHAQKAKAGATQDTFLARNIGQISGPR
jgi:hypothetical protein